MRLQKYMASCGVASRRKAEEIIQEGRVAVNGKTVTELGFKIQAEDSVKVDGKRIRPKNRVYIVFNKPEGCISAAADDKGRPTVTDMIGESAGARVFPVGRLDFNTTGCLLMTNDGEWANKITHPKFMVQKAYTAKLKGRLESSALNKLKKGIRIENRMVRPLKVYASSKNRANDAVTIVITEGLNHQVKKMLAAVGSQVVRLRRDSVGIVTIKGLPGGRWRHLTKEEVGFFKK